MSKKNLVGLDIGSYYTKIVELEERKGVVVIKKAIKERTPDLITNPEEMDIDVMAEFLSSVFSQYKIKNKNAALALNSSFVITKTVNMPLVVDEEIEQAVMWEAEQYAPFGIEQVNVSYQIMNRDSEKNEMTVLIVLTKREIVNSYLNAVKKAKLNIRILDVDVFAMANAFSKNQTELDKKHNMIVDVGYNSTKIVFLKSGVPTFSRYVEFGFKSIIDDASAAFNMPSGEIEMLIESSSSDSKRDSIIAFINDKTERLYSQLQNSINFYESNVLDNYDDIDNIVFSGAFGVMFDYLKDSIPAELINKNVIRFNPFAVFSSQENIFEDVGLSTNSLYSIAVGLAVRGL